MYGMNLTAGILEDWSKYTGFPLSPHRARQLYRTEDLLHPNHPVTVAALRTAIKEPHFLIRRLLLSHVQ